LDHLPRSLSDKLFLPEDRVGLSPNFRGTFKEE